MEEKKQTTDTKGTEKKRLSRAEKISREKERLEAKLFSGDMRNLTTRVAWVLNHSRAARNSDVRCQIDYWKQFEPDIYSANIDVRDLYKLTRLTSIARARAKIQNEYELFLADTEIRKRRGQLSEEEKLKQIEDKPDPPIFVVYADETGLTEKMLSVGSLWILSDEVVLTLFNEISAIKKEFKFNKEIHFKEIKPSTLPFYESIVEIIHQCSSYFSFKAISVSHDGLKDKNRNLEDLFYHLLTKGIEHEIVANRAKLPRTLTFVKDADKPGADKIMLANLEDRMKNYSVLQQDSQLKIGTFKPLDSKPNILLQVADLFSGSVNRRLNFDIDDTSPKSKIARIMLRFFKQPDEIDLDDYTFWGEL
jgi:hypothetical protein